VEFLEVIKMTDKEVLKQALIEAYRAGREGSPFNFDAKVATIFAPEIKPEVKTDKRPSRRLSHKLVDYDDSLANAVKKDTY